MVPPQRVVSYKPRGSLVAVVLVPLRSRIMYTQPDKQKKEKNTISPFFFPKQLLTRKRKIRKSPDGRTNVSIFFRGSIKPKSVNFFYYFLFFGGRQVQAPSAIKALPSKVNSNVAWKQKKKKGRSQSTSTQKKRKKKI